MPQFTSLRTSYFALLESYAPQLLAGPEVRTPFQRPRSSSPGAVFIGGVLGSESDWFADTSYESIRAAVRQAVKDPSARTIDLFIDSPGGAVLGLPETADVISAANLIKPVRSFVTGIAASAAYWLASQGGTISLTPSGEVGSIGVLDLHVGIADALKQSGVTVTAVSSTPQKVERAPFTELSDDARQHMQKNVDSWYSDFLSAVRRGRGARVNANGNYGGGRMLSARDAKQLGLVDFIQKVTL